ncbi:hypothetical protein SFA35_25830 (plasmid) [Pseudomonas sp. HR96]|uniref:hypothetical protein n=1 Tax=Pseudomonas sp. HR96 TaxID=1027966 RepID=UPI002A74B294|nr:hypothetical protein [Pseudomonas sp. HR96]WPP02415.1 hypothetical protein SFA35_25830 [Pseudomonas sp. HR96]
MGQAKQRGNRAERMAQTLNQKREAAEALGLERRDLNELREELGLPQDAQFHGYIIHIVESDEFLAEFKSTAFATSRSWTKNPGLARLFEHFIDAYELARVDSEIVVGLFETQSQFIVAEVL